MTIKSVLTYRVKHFLKIIQCLYDLFLYTLYMRKINLINNRLFINVEISLYTGLYTYTALYIALYKFLYTNKSGATFHGPAPNTWLHGDYSLHIFGQRILFLAEYKHPHGWS